MTPALSSAEPLGALYRAHGPAIYRRCRRLLNDGQAAEDATHETFLRVQRQGPNCPQVAEVAWLLRIATNCCLNELRRRRVHARPAGELTHIHDQHASTERLVADRQRVERVIAAVPEPLREAAWLRYVDGLPLEAVARILGISRRTVVYRLAHFRQRARRLLARG